MLGDGPCRPWLLVSGAWLRWWRGHAERCKGHTAGGVAASPGVPEAALASLALLGTGKAGTTAPGALWQLGYLAPSRAGDGMRLVLALCRLLHSATATVCLASSGALAHLLWRTASLLLVSAGTGMPLLVLGLRRRAVHPGEWICRRWLMGWLHS